MIDLRALRENPEPARASQRARGADESLVDRIIEADESRRAALTAFETARAEQKAASRSVGKAARRNAPPSWSAPAPSPSRSRPSRRSRTNSPQRRRTSSSSSPTW